MINRGLIFWNNSEGSSWNKFEEVEEEYICVVGVGGIEEGVDGICCELELEELESEWDVVEEFFKLDDDSFLPIITGLFNPLGKNFILIK